MSHLFRSLPVLLFAASVASVVGQDFYKYG